MLQPKIQGQLMISLSTILIMGRRCEQLWYLIDKMKKIAVTFTAFGAIPFHLQLKVPQLNIYYSSSRFYGNPIFFNLWKTRQQKTNLKKRKKNCLEIEIEPTQSATYPISSKLNHSCKSPQTHNTHYRHLFKTTFFQGDPKQTFPPKTQTQTF